MTTPPDNPRMVYQASGARRVGLAMAFLLLLPFSASVPIMLFQRVTQGIWLGTPGLLLLGLGFAIIQSLILIQLMQAVRTRLVLGQEDVEMTLPAGRWLTPLLRYDHHAIRYDAIQAVERRQEVYGGRLAPVLMTGIRIIPKDGLPIRLGYVNALNEDPALPVVTIGEEVARRADIAVLDRGTVQRSLQRKLIGASALVAHAEPLAGAQIAGINASHRRVVWATGVLLALLLAGGIAFDLTQPPPGGTPRLAAGTPSQPAKAKQAPAPKAKDGKPQR